MTAAMHKGSCLCGVVSFELRSEPKATTHCHCKMCQKQHGAAFATYASVPKSDLKYTAGQEALVSYNSSKSIMRKFCGICGSNIEWNGSEKYPDWVSFAVASLDTEFNPESIRRVHLDSRVCWLEAQGTQPIAVLVHVTDWEKGFAWYQAAFPDAAVVQLPDFNFRALQIDNFFIEVVRADEKVASGKSGTVLYWSVADLAESIQRFQNLGSEIYRGPMPIENGQGMCQMTDPFGNLLGLRGPFNK